MHNKVTHGLEKLAVRRKVPVLFSTPHKLGRLCVHISGKPKRKKCKKKYAKRLVPCDVGVVYDIPLSCGEAYTGLTGGRCVNDSAREHNLSLGRNTGPHSRAHCDQLVHAIQSFAVEMHTFTILGKS